MNINNIGELQSTLLPSGTQFVVMDNTEGSYFTSGTTGFIIASRPWIHDDYIPCAILNTVIVKKGKTGRARLDFNNIITPTYTIVDTSCKHWKIMQHRLPMHEKFYTDSVKPFNEYTDMFNLRPVEFLGWCGAYAQYILNLSQYATHQVIWPEDKTDGLNIAIRIKDIWDSDPELALERYTTHEMRERIVVAIREKETELVKCSKINKLKTDQHKIFVLRYIASHKLTSSVVEVETEVGRWIQSMSNINKAKHTL
jgi:hypothetical protein